MKVLHFHKTYLPGTGTIGGIECAIHHLARGTSRLGVTTEVLALDSTMADSVLDHLACIIRNWEIKIKFMKSLVLMGICAHTRVIHALITHMGDV